MISDRGTLTPGVPAVARSALFVPASEPAKLDKALATDLDAVILDLEDAVLPDMKAGVRASLPELMARPRGSTNLYVRINSPIGPWGVEDLKVLAPLDANCVMVPKADPESIGLAAELTALPLIALVETAVGIVELDRIAAHPQVARLMIGQADLAAELGCPADAASLQLQQCRGRVVVASAAAGLAGPLDGPCLKLRDEAELEREIELAAGLGFAGKACIHPAQIETVNRGFTATAEEVAWAEAVISGFEADRSTGLAVVDGEMVDLPVVKRAERILARIPKEE